LMASRSLSPPLGSRRPVVSPTHDVHARTVGAAAADSGVRPADTFASYKLKQRLKNTRREIEEVEALSGWRPTIVRN